MITFILNNQTIKTTAPKGMALLDFIRHNQQLKGTKLVCKEGECGACTVLVGQAINGELSYQSMTSCITPLINAHGKHIVTIEGLNMDDLSPIQQAMLDLYGTQCGFCTPGFVVSLSGYLIAKQSLSKEGIIAAIDGNICRCTGYKSIERACEKILSIVKKDLPEINISTLVHNNYIPSYFSTIPKRLSQMDGLISRNRSSNGQNGRIKLGGGTDLYVQRPIEMYEANPMSLYDQLSMKSIDIKDGFCTFGASLTMGDLMKSDVFKKALPASAYIFKLLASTPIRNMATIGGNLVNASPIGDFSILLLALDSTLILDKKGKKRQIALQSFFKSYKKIDLQEGEIVEKIKFKIPNDFTKVHFEKVSQRKYFDIASVNFASKLNIKNQIIEEVHLAVGGVGPIPIYLSQTSTFLKGQLLHNDLIKAAIPILNQEIAPISDARGSDPNTNAYWLGNSLLPNFYS